MKKSDEKALVKCLNWADKKKIKVKFSKKRATAKFKLPGGTVKVALFVNANTGFVWADFSAKTQGVYGTVTPGLVYDILTEIHDGELPHGN